MRRSIPVLAALLLAALATPTTTRAQGMIDLSWDDCAVTAANWNKNFACDTDAAVFRMFATYRLDAPASFQGAAATVRARFAGSDVPDWWRFNSGECRAGSAIESIRPNTVAGCIGGYNAIGANSGFVTQSPGAQPYESILQFNWFGIDFTTVPAGVTRTLVLEIRSSYTIGNSPQTGTPCAGCAIPACFTLESVRVGSGPTSGTLLTQTGTRNFVTWQDGHDVHGSCPGSVPAKNSTWGSVKSLYR